MNIKILGPGCARCHETEALVRAVAEETGCTADVEKVTDFREMLQLGVMTTPAVLVDDRVMCSGRMPTREEVRDWLAGAGQR
ncbi:thioredoxin family protein [uncultured Desulfovibrio sp.]|uniref:thioredoxin family protein n=1 Tax=uncultured Desulfovibrio sp. TaxID=167968 RepID=UPI0026188486|nr:thioredoxin family protein [uncultured Desulfovibrio sp.]